MSDQEIIEGCLNGRKKAQDELYRVYSGRLFVVCLRYAGNRPDAEDVLQEGFIRIFKKFDTFSREKNTALYPWIRRIMVNTVLNYLRDNKKYRFSCEINENNDLLTAEAEEDSIEDLFDDIAPEEILTVISELPEGYRTVFNLFAFEEYKHNEIARILDISVNTSKTQLMKARKAIISKIKMKVSSVEETKQIIR
ncbi:MAG: sigma-70 family RNA polymerase sigma factor [Bacteroidia bacterium]|nr:sigma-70 family RNA polymerase sigma factor [Bacteroidia bacterium]